MAIVCQSRVTYHITLPINFYNFGPKGDHHSSGYSVTFQTLKCRTGHQRQEHRLQNDDGKKCKRNANKKYNHPRNIYLRRL